MRPFNVAVVLALAHAGVARWVPRQPSSDLVTRQEPEGPVEDDTHKLCTYFVTVTSKLENCQWLSDYWGISYEDFMAWVRTCFSLSCRPRQETGLWPSWDLGVY